METTIQVPCYVSRVTALPTSVAQALFDEWCRPSDRDAGDAPVVNVPDGELVIEPTTLERFDDPGFVHPYRRVGGTLRFRDRWMRDLGVELELGPWSGTHSELAVRYAGRRILGGRRGDRFAALAADVLDVLEATLAWHRTRAELADERMIIAA